MLCGVCQPMLYRHRNRIGRGSRLKLEFKHHLKESDLHESAEAGCYLCKRVTENLTIRGIKAQEYERSDAFLNASIEAFTELGRKGLYQLDFHFPTNPTLIASFILKQDDPTSSVSIPSKPVSETTADPIVIEKAKEWINECRTTHEKCRRPNDSNWHPNRLLDLQKLLKSGQATGQVRIVSVKGEESSADDPPIKGPYVTLSHCWGALPFLKLKRDTLTMFLNGLPLERLPKTFQHAAKVCCELNIRWLWIDALCIIQDDEGLADWLEESTTMEQVYANSYCNISATAARDSSYGLFNPRDTSREWVGSATLDTKGLLHESQGRVRCTILDLSFWDKYVDGAPVNRRSWVYQERLLAPRVLHWCQDQIAFECLQVDRAESLPEGLPHFRIKSGLLINSLSLKSLDLAAGAKLRAIREASSGKRGRLQEMVDEVDQIDEVGRKLDLYELWKHWVEVYTKMDLTNQQDRLIALSGIARMMFSRMEAEGYKERYIAGMWEKYLANQLLWSVNESRGKDRQPNENTRTKEYRAPTFSWASVETRRGITFPVTKNLTEDDKQLADVEEVQIKYRNPKDHFGLITDGHIVLQGVLHKIELTDLAQRVRKAVHSNGSLLYTVGFTRLLWVTFATYFIPIASTFFQVGGILHLHRYRRLLASWTLVHVASGALWFGLKMLRDYRIRDDEDDDTDATGYVTADQSNRYSWRFVRGGGPSGQSYSIVHLDSPSSEPTIFGPDAQVHCLPMLKEKTVITCLLVQAKGCKPDKSGMYYQRVGLTQIQSLTRDPLDALTTLPESNETETGEYYEDSQGLPKGKSKICIV